MNNGTKETLVTSQNDGIAKTEEAKGKNVNNNLNHENTPPDLSQQEIKNYRELLSIANSFCMRLKESRCKNETSVEYIRVCNRYLNGKKLGDVKNKNTYWKEKKSIEYTARRAFTTCFDTLRKNQQVDKITMHTISSFVDLLRRNNLINPPKGCPIKKPTPLKSKRKSFPKGEKDWVIKFWEGIPPKTKYRDIVAILCVAGARPSEIAKGVKIVADETKQKINVSIQGTKRGIDNQNGQELRTIRISCTDNASAPTRYLFNLAKGRDQKGYTIICKNTKNLYDFVRYWGIKLFGKKENPISPYSFRHQFAADIKAEKIFDKEKKAKLLGQRSDRTQKNYGSAKQGRGGRGIEAVEATNKVRLHEYAENFPSASRPKHNQTM